MKHIKETLKHFSDLLAERILEVDRMQGDRPYGYNRQGGLYDTPGMDCGVLGSIISGNYENFELRRDRIRKFGEKTKALGLTIDTPQLGTESSPAGEPVGPAGPQVKPKGLGAEARPFVPAGKPFVPPHLRGPGGSPF